MTRQDARASVTSFQNLERSGSHVGTLHSPARLLPFAILEQGAIFTAIASNRIHSRSKRRKARLSASVAHGPPQDCVGHRGSFCHDRSRGPSCGPRSHGESRITHKKRRGGRGPPWPCPGAANCLPHPRGRRRRARLLQRWQRVHRLDPRPVAREPLAGRPRATARTCASGRALSQATTSYRCFWAASTSEAHLPWRQSSRRDTTRRSAA